MKRMWTIIAVADVPRSPRTPLVDKPSLRPARQRSSLVLQGRQLRGNVAEGARARQQAGRRASCEPQHWNDRVFAPRSEWVLRHHQCARCDRTPGCSMVEDIAGPIDPRLMSDAAAREASALAKRPFRPQFLAAFSSAIRALRLAPLRVLEPGSGPGFLARSSTTGMSVRPTALRGRQLSAQTARSQFNLPGRAQAQIILRAVPVFRSAPRPSARWQTAV
jgi:hypothetical protein